MRRLFLPLIFLILLTTGCGELMDETFQHEDRHLAPGFTPCGDFVASFGERNVCNPNQYCADQTFSTCLMGCLSEYNCTDNQQCVKDEGADVGTCVQQG